MFKLKISLIFIFISLLSFGAEISGTVSTEYSACNLNKSSKFNPNNIQKMNELKYQITGELIIKNQFSPTSNGVLKIESKYTPADFSSSSDKQEIYIKEGYIDILTEYAAIRAGKQFIKWGDGIFFNPSDIVNISRDPLKKESSQVGNNFIQLSVPFGTVATVDILGLIKEGESSKPSDILGVIRTSASFDNLSGFIYISAEKGKKPIYGFNANYVLPISNSSSLSLYSEGNYKRESGFKYMDESGKIFTRDKNSYLAISCGTNLNLRFPSLKRFDKLSLTAEFMSNRENWSNYEYKNYVANSDKSSEPLYTQFKGGKNYLYSGALVSNVVFNLVDVNIGNVSNLDDGSGIALISADYQYSDSTTLSANSKIFYGSSDKEFGNNLSDYEYGVSGKVSF